MNITGHIEAGDQYGSALQHVAIRRLKSVAGGNSIAAYVSVFIGTREVATVSGMAFVLLVFMKVTTWTLICATPAFFSTALVRISLSAVLIQTLQVSSIMPQKPLRRAIVQIALAFICAANLIIKNGASAIDARRLCVLIDQDFAWWASVNIAHCNRITTSVPFFRHASFIFTSEIASVDLDDKIIWTPEGTAHAVLPAAFAHVCVCAVFIVAQGLGGIEPMQVASRAVVLCAVSLLVSTSFQIFMFARRV
jgi:hypothetical protein